MHRLTSIDRNWQQLAESFFGCRYFNLAKKSSLPHTKSTAANWPRVILHAPLPIPRLALPQYLL